MGAGTSACYRLRSKYGHCECENVAFDDCAMICQAAARKMEGRISHILTTTDLTPRSGGAIVKQIASTYNEQMYREAQLALTTKQVQHAKNMFASIPLRYRRTEEYIRNCDTYLRLQEQCILQDSAVHDLKHELMNIFPTETDQSLRRMSHSLNLHGYTAASIEDITIDNIEDVVKVCELKPGHTHHLHKHAHSNSSHCQKMNVALRTIFNEVLELFERFKRRRG